MNRVTLIGNVTKDIELKKTSNDTSYCRFTLAVPRHYKDGDGEKITDFISVVAWRKTAEILNKYVKKGNKIGLDGEIQTSKYEVNGETKYNTEVLVTEVAFLNKKEDKE